jgi:hypothetical protein
MVDEDTPHTTKCSRESKINEAVAQWVEVCALSIGLLFVSSWHTVHHHRRRERKRWAITVDSPSTSPLCIHSSCSRSNKNPSSTPRCFFFCVKGHPLGRKYRDLASWETHHRNISSWYMDVRSAITSLKIHFRKTGNEELY